MGVPCFKVRNLGQTKGLVALSANFTLIADMSDRIMSLAAGLGISSRSILLTSHLGMLDAIDDKAYRDKFGITKR